MPDMFIELQPPTYSVVPILEIKPRLDSIISFTLTRDFAQPFAPEWANT
jgi:hypothetical protein